MGVAVGMVSGRGMGVGVDVKAGSGMGVGVDVGMGGGVNVKFGVGCGAGVAVEGVTPSRNGVRAMLGSSGSVFAGSHGAGVGIDFGRAATADSSFVGGADGADGPQPVVSAASSSPHKIGRQLLKRSGTGFLLVYVDGLFIVPPRQEFNPTQALAQGWAGGLGKVCHRMSQQQICGVRPTCYNSAG